MAILAIFWSLKLCLLHVRRNVCMGPFHVRSEFCIAPIHVQSKFADCSPHMKGSPKDFSLHMERRHSFKSPIFKRIFKDLFLQSFMTSLTIFDNKNIFKETTFNIYSVFSEIVPNQTRLFPENP